MISSVIELKRNWTSEVTVGLTGKWNRVRNLVTGEVIQGHPPEQNRWGHRRPDNGRTTFKMRLLPHSYEAWVPETGVVTAEQ